jgi:orotidine-5'-phosphate decarboxylase
MRTFFPLLFLVVLVLLIWVYLEMRDRQQETTWQRAVQAARWDVTTKATEAGCEFYIVRVARAGDRREVLEEEWVEVINTTGLDDGQRAAAFAEALGRTRNWRDIRNTEYE